MNSKMYFVQTDDYRILVLKMLSIAVYASVVFVLIFGVL